MKQQVFSPKGAYSQTHRTHTRATPGWTEKLVVALQAPGPSFYHYDAVGNYFSWLYNKLTDTYYFQNFKHTCVLITLGDLWQHLLLIYFNIVIMKGCIKHWSLPDIPIRLKLNVGAQLGLQGIFQHLFIWMIMTQYLICHHSTKNVQINNAGLTIQFFLSPVLIQKKVTTIKHVSTWFLLAVLSVLCVCSSQQRWERSPRKKKML